MSCNAVTKQGSENIICDLEHPHPDQKHKGLDRDGKVVEWDQEQW